MKSKTKMYDTDHLMLNLWFTLERDFRTNLQSELPHPAVKHLQQGVVPFRDYVFPFKSQAPAYLYKCEAQLEGLFKRYRFAHDKYTNSELEDITNRKFQAVQEQLAQGYRSQMSESTFQVIKLARAHVKRILGKFSSDELLACCRFGKNATFGCPASDAYIDQKLLRSISGSVKHHKWFREEYLPTDKMLGDILERNSQLAEATRCELEEHPFHSVVWALTQTNVPKSYKILRGINPNTLLGSFHSAGLSVMLEDRLTDEGLNIRYLQQRHRRLVKIFSKTRTHATGDLQNASHCFTSALVRRLVPRDWYNAFNLGRLSSVEWGEHGNDILRMESFMTMGIGFTFTLQTLLFYSILKAVTQLSEVKGFVSVYGDDLIYPRKAHKYVTKVFADLGFTFNREKTYVEDHFRESCGSDYFHGIDVRPFRPEGEHQLLGRLRYLSFVYKILNGLLHRWDKVEITQTFRFLILEILRVSPVVHQVPLYFPDYSGVKVSSIQTADMEINWAKVRSNQNGSLEFESLGLTFEDRPVRCLYSYLWDTLRSSGQREEFAFNVNDSIRPDSQTILWLKAKPQPRNYRSKITGKRITLMQPTVKSKNGSYRVTRLSSVAISLT